MIEIIYKEEQKKADGNESFFRIPNNIRQIGDIKGHQKIYIEDYAYTFLRKISRSPQTGGKAALLFGKYHWSEGYAYLFIKSALQIQDMEVSQEHVVFTEKIWGQVYEDSKKYFQDQEIVGWFVSLPGFNMQMNEVLLKTHLNHFAGNDKVLFVVEPGEWEEAFFVYENNQLTRQPGYYIYYEKNELMQAYMIEMSQNKSIEETEKVPDRAVVDFRRAVKEKKEAEPETVKSGKASKVSWLAAGCSAAAVLAIGITFFNSYEGMRSTLGNLIPGIEASDEKPQAAPVNAEAQPETSLTPQVTKEAQDQLIPNDHTVTPSAEPAVPAPTSSPESDDTAKTAEESKPEAEQPDTQPTGEPAKDTPQEEEPDNATDEPDVQTASSPNGAYDVAKEYVIQKGDTMSSICKQKYGSIARMEEICRLNGISPEDIIYAGQKILLPD